jgi:ABC-2 type transport system ATP-binding protein
VRNDASSDAVLVADGLSKSYDEDVVLADLSFRLDRGRVMGFLGPNGAGKTTSIRILTTITPPSKGRFVIDGIGSEKPGAIRPLIGVLPESLGLPRQITGLEYITYFARLYGWRRSDARVHAESLLDLVGLRTKSRRLIRTYSHGMRQRLGIARALVNDPVVLFLDEPVVGLDPRGQEDLLRLIRDVAVQRRAGIIVCSHSLPDVEAACDDVVILSAGRVVASGPLSDVVRRASHDGPAKAGMIVRVPAASIERATSTLRAMDEVNDIEPLVDGQLRIVVDGRPGATRNGGAANDILEHLIDAHVPVEGFEIEGSRLSDVFMELTEERSA